jgi:hypothetical protein
MSLLLHSALTALLLPLPISQCAIIDEDAGDGEASFPFPLSLFRRKCAVIQAKVPAEEQ